MNTVQAAEQMLAMFHKRMDGIAAALADDTSGFVIAWDNNLGIKAGTTTAVGVENATVYTVPPIGTFRNGMGERAVARPRKMVLEKALADVRKIADDVAKQAAIFLTKKEDAA